MEREDLNLLEKYLKGETTPEQTEYVRDLLIRQSIGDDEPAGQLLLKEWEQTSKENQSGIDINETWLAFKQKMQTRKLDDNAPTRWKRFLVAASLAAILVSSAVVYFINSDARKQVVLKEEVTYITKSASRGEKLNISFPDGSFIKLNSSSRLLIPSNYNDDRTVFLEGEAFFEVQKYENRPFKVITGQVTTEVLGTSFNVNAIKNNDEVSIAVVEGRVRVANQKHSIELYPQEMTRVNPNSQSITKTNFDIESVTGWRNNILIFNKVSFDETIEILKAWYGVEFIIEGEITPKGMYSGRFENKSLQLVLEGLGFSSAFNFRIVDKVVYLRF